MTDLSNPDALCGVSEMVSLAENVLVFDRLSFAASDQQ